LHYYVLGTINVNLSTAFRMSANVLELSWQKLCWIKSSNKWVKLLVTSLKLLQTEPICFHSYDSHSPAAVVVYIVVDIFNGIF
jgi:hypothetical protein